ncbi:GGDEF domain-containing protein [Clostridium sp. PL3]|uniref:GGDEF domain-containing protein n=1 Tax=Clostridium thailandense TaxID=2794346 RepID=A0A949TTR4_9CLOT|nr:GGDEF domain-containing protein [Clostridium thailandense]MBV7271726.1 GGDEF domain-containing protein [Clostridium thailandense]
MDKFFIKFTPYIIATNVLAVHLLGYILTLQVEKRWYFAIWLAVALIDVAFAFRCGRLIQNLHRNVYEDALTKVKNRGFFYLRMSEEIEKLKKINYRISLLMIDIDNFKVINDTYGHIAGDSLVKQLASILSQKIRKSDNIIRWGGDEFAIILPESTHEEAYNIAERIRNVVQDYSFYHNNVLIKMTISIGIASVKDEIEIDTFVDLADSALYKSKRTRNSVTNLNYQ